MAIPTGAVSPEHRVVECSSQDAPSESPISQDSALSNSLNYQCSAIERAWLKRIVQSACPQQVRVVAGNGPDIADGTDHPTHTIRFMNRDVVRKVLRNPMMGFLDGYTTGAVQIEGDLIELLNHFQRAFSLRPETPTSLLNGVKSFLRKRKTLNSQKNVSHHYDLSNEFYQLWLDRQMVYTCAYFEDETRTLEEAQRAKIDHVCKKLRLQPGNHVIEAGCGWGALALHMAEHYGCHVRAFNLSNEQLAYARQQAVDRKLDKQVEFIKGDWREIQGECDAFVSVGMLEHVGPENYQHLGRVIRKVLKPNGRGLIHSIGQNTTEPLCPWIEQRIFPGAQPPTLKQMMDIFGPTNLSVLDVENLRPHYAWTLRHWLERFNTQSEKVRKMFGGDFERMWRMYLASSVSAFETGSLQLYQVLFAPIESTFFPRTRADLYCQGGC